VRALRPLSPRTLSINRQEVPRAWTRAYDAAGADVYCAFGASAYAAGLAEYCRARGRKFVLFVSSDNNLSPDNRPGNTALDVYGSRHDLNHYALARADILITQTTRQQRLLRERFGRDSITIPNPIELAGDKPPVEFAGRTHVLWVGKANTVKQPEILLRLAAEFPRVGFTMVLNRSDPGIFDRAIATATPNVTIRDFVPYAESDGLFRDARALINTSRFEGFPNTFLQAGKSGVPLLSLEADPDGFIARHECGLVAGGDYRRLARGLALLHGDEARWRTCSANIAAYVRAHHDLDSAAERLSQALTEGR
jgi:glycosyltransferase involved in cell wall biosynthesis